MSIHSMGQQPNDKNNRNIRVFVRVRPFNEKQIDDKTCIAFSDEKNISIKQKDSKEHHNFTFDGIFSSQATQYQVYQKVGCQIVNEAFNGINGTIFCYGQTSSGKTHTCIGPNYLDENLAGILPRLIKETLTKIEQSPKNIEAKMKISMVQIYNEKIKDLLEPSKSDLKIRSSKKQGIFLQNATQKYILVEEEAFTYLNTGIGNRSVNATNMNSQSSRSHMVFIITLNTHDIYSGEAKNAKVILVDLAGSQKISKTGAEGKVLEEAKKINTSLTTLGKVINALSDGKSAHIPYRDSKLTRLLQQSLGGNSLTNLIVNISPSSYNQSQTLTSIRFGQRAKTIKNEPVVNKSYTVDQLLVLLKKAQETIQKQSAIIKQLEKKKRTGGYGAIMIPAITMHFIDDEQKSDRSIQCEEREEQNQNLLDSKTSAFSLRSEHTIMNQWKSKTTQHIGKENEKEEELFPTPTKRAQTDEGFYKRDQNLLCQKKELQNQNLLEQDKIQIQPLHQIQNLNQISQNKMKHLNGETKIPKVCKFSPEIDIPKTIIEDDQQNIQSPRNIQIKIDTQQKKSTYNDDFISTQQNLDKIRQNLFQLKLRYLQQKRQSSIKSMIIDRKNRIIEKIKNSMKTQLIR